MKKIIYTLLIIFGFCVTSFAQQLPQYTQYQLNEFIINPAIAGSKNYFQARSNNRYQWEGITDAPRTFTLSVDGPLQTKKMGIGGYIFVDVTGPTRRTGFSLAYSYHIQIADNMHLSMAINGGLLQYSIDGSEIVFENPNDNIAVDRLRSTLIPDAGFSLYLYSDKFYFGASAPQLIKSKIQFKETIEKGKGRIADHYFAVAGYKFDVADKIQIEPSVLVKYVDPIPVQYEGTLRAIYDNQYWAGVSYRKDDAVALVGGITLNKTFSLGYSYDFIQSSIAKYSTGTHELMIGIRFPDKPNNAPKEKKPKKEEEEEKE